MPRSILILIAILLTISGIYYFVMSGWSSRPINGQVAATDTTKPDSTVATEEKKPGPQIGLHNARAGLERANKARLQMAVVTARMNANCGFSDSGGYTKYKPSEAATRLVKIMTAASKPAPGDRRIPGPTITFTLQEVSRDWQVVVIPDDELNRMLIEGYASSSESPVFTEEISCR